MSNRRLRKLLHRIRFPLILGLLIVFLSGDSLSFLQNALKPKLVTLQMVIQAVEAPIWREVIEKFEQENQNIHIQIVEKSDATDLVENVYVRAFESEKSRPRLIKRLTSIFPEEQPHYDLVYMDIIWLPRFAKQGWLVDLKELISKEKLEELRLDFLPKDWNGGIYRDKLYRIPFHSDVGLLYYRKDLLKKLGYTEPPKTFADLMKISISLQAKKPQLAPWGYIWQGQQYEGLVAMFVEILQGYGGFWIKNPENSSTLEVGLDQEKAFKAVRFLRSTIDKNISPRQVTSYTERETISIFQKGEAVFLRNWPYVSAEANAASSKIQGNFALTTMVHEKNSSSGACQGGWGLGIARSSKHKNEALKAIQFLTSAATQRKYALKTGNMPARRSLFNDPQLVARYSYYPKLLELSQHSVLRPAIPEYTEASQILQKHLSCVLAKQTITEEEIQKEMILAASKTRALLKGNKQEDDSCGK